MSMWSAKIEGDFTDEPREYVEATMDYATTETSKITAEILEDGEYCQYCHTRSDDVVDDECQGNDDEAHVFVAPALAWMDRASIALDSVNDEVEMVFRPTGKAGRVNITFKVDAETGKIRMVVDTRMVMNDRSLELRQVDAEDPNGQRTDFLIG